MKKEVSVPKKKKLVANTEYDIAQVITDEFNSIVTEIQETRQVAMQGLAKVNKEMKLF